MEIDVKCPECTELYHLPAAMLGKSMRCQYCRAVFPVELPKPVTLVDLLPGELLETVDPAPPEAKPKPAWADAPPPVRDPKASPTNGVNHASWDAPPVRRPKEAEKPAERKSEPEVELAAVLPRRNRIARVLIGGFLVFAVAGLTVAGLMLWQQIVTIERRMRAAADAEYDKGGFSSAGQKYAELAKRFASSEFRERYDFRSKLSEIRGKIGNDPEAIDDLLDDIKQLMTDHDQKPVLAEHASDLGDALVKLLVDFANKGLDDPATQALERLKEGKVDDVIRQARAIKPAPGSRPVAWAEIDAARDKLEKKAELARQRKRVFDQLAELAKTPSYTALRLAERLVEAEKENFPDIANSAEVRAAFDAIYSGHLSSVRYVREGAAAAAVEEDDQPALLVGPLLAGTPGNATDGGTVLALARGVLYGLSHNNGRIRWARRVGIDTTTLPARVPAGFGNGERVLALSSDTSTLDALDPADGTTLWRYRLGTPSLGRPVVIGRRAYLATYSGAVHEIELAEGRLLGRYLLGHRLTAGGTHEAGTNRLYVPADDGCVYVLQVGADPKCEMILYTRHPAASLRGEPVVIPSNGAEPGYLILNQTAGLRATDLKVYELPLLKRDAEPRALKPRAEMDGWTWFPPQADPEKLVMLTDGGMLGVFGIKQAGTNDPPLFSLLPAGGLRLETLRGGGGAPGRSAVVQVQGNDYWTLALGRLQRLRLAWDAKEGPKLVPVWPDAPLVGSPLHEGQSAEGGSRLVVVTQPAGRSAVWATCVDEQRGEVRWRRQIGLVCQGEPVAVPVAAGGPLLL
ncbi:MAG: PQQ-binding-like beta-propeller repeat protein, partial [Gemmataceae bacterium]